MLGWTAVSRSSGPCSTAFPIARIGAAARALEPACLAGLVLLALVLRARNLADIPRYTDEVNEVQVAAEIAQGRMFPQTSGPKHIGAFFDYLLAGGMLVFGRSPDLPRQVALLAGLATVLLVYGYARLLGGRLAALVAAGLLAVSALHVLLSSRVAWSASLTPLLLTATAVCLERAISTGARRYLLAGGLSAGLALQAHPSTVLLLPGFGAFLLWHGRSLFRRPTLYAAGALLVAGCSNLLIYNWQSGLGGLRSIRREHPGAAMDPASYPANLLALMQGLAAALSSAIDPTAVVDALSTEPYVALVAVVSLIALVHLAIRGGPLPLLVTLSAAALLPFSHDDFSPLLKARYVMPLLPLCYVALGVLVARLWTVRYTTSTLTIGRLAAAAFTIGLAGRMLLSLLSFESLATASDCSNTAQRAFIAEVHRNVLPGEVILLDEASVRPAERLGYLFLLKWSGDAAGEASLVRGGVQRELAARSSFLTAVEDGAAASLFEKQGVPLLPQNLTPSHPAVRERGPDVRKGDGGIGLYRVSAAGAMLLAHGPQPACSELGVN